MGEQTTLLNGRVGLLQSKDGLRASMDSVLLAAVVNARENDHVLDMGCGTGAVGLCVHERLNDLSLSVTGVDVQQKLIHLAQKNVDDNHLKGISYICADIHDKSVFKREAFDHIVMNPPYYKEGVRQASPDQVREQAYTGDLELWIGAATHWLKQGGSLNIIHRADCLDKILRLSDRRYGAIEIWPVYSKEGGPAKRIIVRMIRNRKTPLTIHPPFILYDVHGQETVAAQAILRDGKALNGT